jgi:hypothetical protein
MRLRRIGLAPLVTLLLALPVLAAAPVIGSLTAHGDRLRDAYFRRQARLIADAALADVKTAADWEKQRPEMRRHFLDMLGLWPLPPRTALRARVTGKIVTDHFTVEKLYFQSSPGLYVTANIYLPKAVDRPVPAVLYLCGHSPVVIDRVPFGNKIYYQHHGAWFARHGYACLVLDTLQLGEVPGLHHGTYSFGMWWWQARGYTPAGVECWNAIRGIDYLQSRKEVDGSRIGVTGRSGGGATSWWVTAADERVRCAVPVAGLADLTAHVCEGYPGRLRDGVVSGHCDCMYFVNTYRWDFTQVMALCAPRPVLLGNSDRDDIFPVAGYRRPAQKVRRLYGLLGASERFQLVETKGPHVDTPELRRGAFRWMNRWLKGDDREVTEPAQSRLTPQQLKVLDRAPDDAINDIAHLRFRRPARADLPEAPEVARAWWAGKAPQLHAALRERVFRGWPDKPPPLDSRPADEIRSGGLRLRAFDFVSEQEVPLRLWVLTHEMVERPSRVIVSVVGEAGWREWVRDLGLPFRAALYNRGNLSPVPYPKRDDGRFAQHRHALEYYKWAFVTVAPRGIGPTRWSEVSKFDGRPAGQQIRRRFALLGQTLDGQRVWDVRRALACLNGVADLNGVPRTVQGRADMAGVALYAALFEPDVARLDLWNPPASHHTGPTFLNVLTVLDMPQAVALAFPRKVRLHVKSEEAAKAWGWPLRLQQALGENHLQVRVVGG